jgi:hypothetical protein
MSKDLKHESQTHDFYIVGGAMKASALSYIARSADQELLEQCKKSHYCYVLTPRQMGKSSLMNRTSADLKDAGIRSVIIDLTEIGKYNVSQEQWYLGHLKRVIEQLKLKIDFHKWWVDHTYLGEVQRFVDFLAQVVLKSIVEPIVIFIDEIDLTLALTFSDDYFAAIRSLYNRRANEPALERLTFVLLGVASPTDLIKDSSRTPFNIGERIHLTDFTFDEAQPLADGLDMKKEVASRMLEQILLWTDGHPYLTHYLCGQLAEKKQSGPIGSDAYVVVESLIKEKFNLDNDQDSEKVPQRNPKIQEISNLQSVHGSMLSDPDLDKILRLYESVYLGKYVENDELSPIHMRLKLVGLVKNDKQGRLQIRNKIYKLIFDEQWISELKVVGADRSVRPASPKRDSRRRRSWRPRPLQDYTIQHAATAGSESRRQSSTSDAPRADLPRQTSDPYKIRSPSITPPSDTLATRSGIRVFVASPSDVLNARNVLEEVVNVLNDIWGPRYGLTLQLLDWRKHVTPYLGKAPEPTILQQLSVDTWDLFVGIMWSRLGTPTGSINPDTGESYKSGTEEEFTLAYKCSQQRGAPKILFYRCMAPIRPDVDPDQLKLVQMFFKQFEQRGQYFGLYADYRTMDEFRRQVFRHLTNALLDFQSGIHIPTQDVGLADGLNQWLAKVGLSGNPFSQWNAGTDTNLSKYFYSEIPYQEELVEASSVSLQPAIVFGKPGSGKTALRQMMIYYSKQNIGQYTALPVLYTDFSPLIEKIAADSNISTRDHVEQLLHAGIQSIGAAVEDGSARMKPNASLESRSKLLKYVHRFGQSLSESQWKTIIDTLGMRSGSTEEIQFASSYIEMFYDFCRTIRIFGYDYVHIFVDQLDESIIADKGDDIVKLLLPLISELGLIEHEDGLAVFRFFLIDRLESSLKKNKIRIGDRIKSYNLVWKDKDLQGIIERRLRFFSTNKSRPFTHLAELSEVDNIDGRLIKASQGSPRNLIILCEYLISEHCRLPITDDNLQITQDDFDKALKRWEDTTKTSDSDSIRAPYSPIDSLPTPIAILTARYYAEQTPIQKLWQAFELAQVILQLMTCSLLAIYKQHAEKDDDLDKKLCELLFNLKLLPTMSAWRESFSRILKIKDAIGSRLVEPFALISKNVGKSISDLIRFRNDAAHGRLGTPDLQTLREVDTKLAELLAAIEPISRVIFVSVEGYEVNAQRSLVHMVRLHRGNVYVPEKRSIVFEANYPVNRVVLYADDPPVSAELWPFVIFDSPEIYLYDRLLSAQDGKDLIVQYLSPVSGRTFRSTDPIPPLQQWGFIS